MRQFAVIGIGRFGSSLATKLYELGYDVLAIDKDEEKIQNIADKVTYAVQADGSDMNALKAIGIRNVDVVIVSIASDINASLMATLIAKELGIREVYAKAQSEQHAKVLYKIGADRVFSPERDMGVRVAHNLVSNNILDLIELDPNHSIIEINALKEWESKNLADLNLRAKHGINVIAIKRGDRLNISPTATDAIEENDVLVVMGENSAISKIRGNES